MCEALPLKVEDAQSRRAERAAGSRLHEVSQHWPSRLQAGFLAFHACVFALSLIESRLSYTQIDYQLCVKSLIPSPTLAVPRLRDSQFPNVNDRVDHQATASEMAQQPGGIPPGIDSQTSRYILSEREHKRAKSMKMSTYDACAQELHSSLHQHL